MLLFAGQYAINLPFRVNIELTDETVFYFISGTILGHGFLTPQGVTFEPCSTLAREYYMERSLEIMCATSVGFWAAYNDICRCCLARTVFSLLGMCLGCHSNGYSQMHFPFGKKITSERSWCDEGK